ncbi:ComEC family competence protein [Alphaproteobacteria bacterium]|nr:ComEC family competence protein [Alphaproteobacteria bacterium]
MFSHMILFLTEFIDYFFNQQKERFVLWTPVCIGIGIFLYFSFDNSFPQLLLPVIGFFLALIGFSFYFSQSLKLRLFLSLVFLILLGIGASHIRTLFAHTPMLEQALQDPVWIKGTIEEVTQGVKQKKIILSVKKIQTLKKYIPKKVQLIYKSKKEKELLPGDFVILKAKLDPLQGPIVPNGYDFKKQAFFKKIGAQGYIVYIHKVIPPQSFSMVHRLNNYRLHLTKKILQSIPGQEGAIAAALTTGDTGSLSKEIRISFSDSGTAHILAISGLHLSLIGGFLFLLTRLLVGFFPPLILRIPAKKIAAVVALIGCLIYLNLSGGRIPTQRAFISFSLMMSAILIDRNPISLRLVALAATIILLISPEVLFTPSFQLSFSAVTGLIAFYETFQIQSQEASLLKKTFFYFFAILLSSLIASISTLPFTLYHFYKFTLQSIGSNLLMIPVLSLWIMPLSLGFVALQWWPFGQEVCSFLLGKGLSLMIFIADTFSTLPGALIYVPGFSMTSFSLTVFGGLILCLLKEPVRWGGGGIILLSALYTFLFPKKIPTLFISEGGKTVGIIYKNHLFVSSPRKDTFLATVWAGYAGIPPSHIHKWKEKPPLSFSPTIYCRGKNCFVSLEKVIIGYMKTKEDFPFFYQNSDILIAPKINYEKGSPNIFLGKKDLSQKSWVYYKKTKKIKSIKSKFSFD